MAKLAFCENRRSRKRVEMFSRFLSRADVNDVGSAFDVSDDIVEVSSLLDESNRHYESAEIDLARKRDAETIGYKDEQCAVENESLQVMSELAAVTEIQENLKKNVENLNHSLQTTVLSLKKFNKMRPSSNDLQNLTRMKKIFGTYKYMLNVYFEYGCDSKERTLRGYIVDKSTKKLAYFEFDKNERSADEISTYMYNKIRSVFTFS